MSVPVLVLRDCTICDDDLTKRVAILPAGTAGKLVTIGTTATADCTVDIDTHGASQLTLVDTIGSFDMSGAIRFGQPLLKINEQSVIATAPAAAITRRAQTSNDSANGVVVAEAPAQTGTAPTGGNSTIVLGAGASAVNDFYVDWFIRITSGPAIDNVRQITAYVGSSKTATLDVPLTVGTLTNSTYSLYSRVYTGMMYSETAGAIRAVIGAGTSYVPAAVDAAQFVSHTALTTAVPLVTVNFASGASAALTADDPGTGVVTVGVEKIATKNTANTFIAAQTVHCVAPQLVIGTGATAQYSFSAVAPAAARIVSVQDMGTDTDMVQSKSEAFVCDYLDDTGTVPLTVDYSHTITRHNSRVTIVWPTAVTNITGGGTIALKSELALPAEYRPSTDLTFVARVLSAGAASLGHVVVLSTGYIYWYSSVNRAAWTGTTNNGFNATAVSY